MQRRAPIARATGVAWIVALGLVCLATACDSPERRRARVGLAIFEANCAPCHGSRGGGAGEPTVVIGGIAVPDLRTLGQRVGRPLPTEVIAEYIDGRAAVEAHGPRSMPVWGDRLYADWPDSGSREEARAGTIALLVEYLESIQID